MFCHHLYNRRQLNKHCPVPTYSGVVLFPQEYPVNNIYRHFKCEDQCFNMGWMYFGGKYSYNILKYLFWTWYPVDWISSNLPMRPRGITITILLWIIPAWETFSYIEICIFPTSFLLNMPQNMKNWKKNKHYFFRCSVDFAS